MNNTKALYTDTRFGITVTQDDVKNEIKHWANNPDFDDFLLFQDLDNMFDMTPVFDVLNKKLNVQPTMDYCNLVNQKHISRELIAQVLLTELQPQMDVISRNYKKY